MRHDIVLHDLMHFIHRPLVQMKADKVNSVGYRGRGTVSCTIEPSAGLQQLMTLLRSADFLISILVSSCDNILLHFLVCDPQIIQ